MKKLSIIALTLAASLMLSACDGGTQNIPEVEPISPTKLEYEFVNNGKYGSGIQINAINTATEDIRFPDTIDGEPVVYISSSLRYSGNVKNLIFPDTVAYCGYIPKSVEFVKLPDTPSVLPSFEGCSSLTGIILPDSITYISSDMFSDCSSLTSINIPEGVTAIGMCAFSDCSSLTSVTLPDSVTRIGNGAFMNCSKLTSINLPDSVTEIGDYAFVGCQSLPRITLPDNVDVRYRVFDGCQAALITYKGKEYTMYDFPYHQY